ncbi:MAG TPA: hypothetical protein VKE42_09150, partial [Candidatus Cybelea sp.]|nr:hypothetical protein [Candidatus Cybelea sp.]
MRARLAALAAAMLLAAAPAPRHSRYLFVWAMEVPHGRAFVATFDVSPDGSSFGKLLAMQSVGKAATMVHHTNYALPPNDVLFANDWQADRTYMFDLANPLNPRVMGQFRDAGPYMYPHSFVYLSNGDTLATFQYTRGFNRS